MKKKIKPQITGLLLFLMLALMLSACAPRGEFPETISSPAPKQDPTVTPLPSPDPLSEIKAAENITVAAAESAEESPTSDVQEASPYRYYDFTSTDPMPIFAELPEDNIRLYSIKPEGLLLQIENMHKVFKWPGPYEQGYGLINGFLPVMEKHDFDNDGIDELAIIILINSGTGVSIMELHLIEYDLEPWRIEEAVFSGDDIAAMIEDDLSLRYDKASEVLTLDAYGITVYEKQVSWLSGESGLRLVLNCIVRFAVEDGQLMLNLGIGYCTDTSGPNYIAELSAKVMYANSQFSLAEIEVERYA